MTLNQPLLSQIQRIQSLIIEKKVQLLPPLSEEQIAIFEREHDILLPSDYRAFISTIGDGGEGPFYGIYPLARTQIEIHKTKKGMEKRLLLCHEGCGFFYDLLVSGDRKGTMAFEHGDEEEGAPYQPIGYGFGIYHMPYTFLDWYEHWLLSGAKTSQSIMKESDIFVNLNEN